MKTRKPRTYVDEHNRAVERYRKASKILLWAGIFNVFALVIGLIQNFSAVNEFVSLPPTYFCFGVVEFIMYVFAMYTSLNAIPLILLTILIAVIISVGMVILSVDASQGRKTTLIASTVLYFVDWLFVAATYFIFDPETILLSAGFHLIFSVMIIVAIYEYYNVINIEKRYKGIKSKEINNENQ